MRKFDLLSGGALFALSLVICGLSLKLEVGRPNHPGPGFYPLVCGAALGVFALLIMLQALGARPAAVRFWKAGANRRRIAAAFAIILLYALMLEPCGFVATTLVFFILISRFVSGHGWKNAAAFSAIATIGIYAVFRFLLRAPLPEGLIERLW
jgi:putative tricarboxylic transport membrane protein